MSNNSIIKDYSDFSPGQKQRFISIIESRLGLHFIPQQETGGKVCFADSPDLRSDYKNSFTSQDILSYSYAISNSSSYDEKYKELLKKGLPCVPCPKDTESFWQLVKLGGELRKMLLKKSHLITEIDTIELDYLLP